MNAPAPGAPALENPFIGVRPYPEGRPLYGREQESAELADLLISRRIVLMYSPSGAGKTSLINTALRKDLLLRGKGRFRTSAAIRVGYVPEAPAANRYVASALRHLERSLPEGQHLPDEALADFSLARYLAERWDPAMQEAAPKSRRDLLVFDQFEELFTLDPTDVDAKRQFLVQVAEALGNRDEDDDAGGERGALRWALFAMREDFIAELDPYKAILPTALATRFRMNLLTREQAKRVILCTAADAGAEFAENAIARIVDDLSRVRAPRGAPGEWVAGLYVEPVQLQVVCRRLWARHINETKRHLLTEDLESPGGDSEAARGLGAVDEALGQFYADCVREAGGGSTTRERALRNWIEGSLVSKAKLRCQVMLDPQTPLPVDNAAVGALGGTILRKETRGGRDWLELTHDRLIEPLLRDNVRWRQQHLSLLQMQADLWHAAGRVDGLLLTGRDLTSSAKWAETHDHELSDQDRAFLKASLDARRNARRKIQYAATSVAAVLLVVLGAWVVLFRTNLELINQKQEAVHQAEEARRERKLSVIRELVSVAEVRRERDLVGALRNALIAAGLVAELEREGAGPEVVASERVAVEGSLLDSLRQAPPILARHTGHQAGVRRAMYTRDGRVVSLGHDGGLRLWRTSDGATLAEVAGEGQAVFAAVLAPSRGLVADADGGERVRLWQLRGETVERVAVIAPPAGARTSRIHSLAFLHGEQVLVAVTWDRRLVFFDVSRPEAARRYASVPVQADVHDAVIQTVAASPDGKTLATGSWDGTVALWRNLPTPDQPQRMPKAERLDTGAGGAERAAVHALTFGPSGNWLAAGGHDGSVFLWELAPRRPRFARRLKGPGGHSATVVGLAFDPAETRLASLALDSRVLLWRLDEAKAATPGTEVPDTALPTLPERLYGVEFDSVRPDVLAVAGAPSVFVVDANVGSGSTLAEPLPTLNGSANLPPMWQAMAITADGQRVAGRSRERLSFWLRRDDGRYLEQYEAAIRREQLVRFAMDASGTVILVGTRDGEVAAYRGTGTPPVALAAAGKTRVHAVAVDPAGRAAAATIGDELHVWRLDGGGEARLVGREALGEARVRALAFDAGGERLAAGAADGTLRVWRLGDQGLAVDIPPTTSQASEINVVLFAPDGRTLLTGAEDGAITAFSLPDLSVARQYDDHRSGVVSLAFCNQADLLRMLSSDRDGTVLVRLSMDQARHTRTLVAGFGRPRHVAVSADCSNVVTGGLPALAWNLEPGSALRKACQLGDPGDDPLPACTGVRQARKP